MGDVYDAEIERLTREYEAGDRNAIVEAWFAGGPLFGWASPSRSVGRRPDGSDCGCLVMVRQGLYPAWTDELTVAIRGDERIPTDDYTIRPEHLPVFAEWNRRLDKELGREPPSPKS